MRDRNHAILVWDTESLIRSQYERKLRQNAFAWEWLQDLLVQSRVLEVPRVRLKPRQAQKILATGLVGEDLNYYVRTAANSPDRRLVTHDSDFDTATCRALDRELDVAAIGAASGCQFIISDADEEDAEL
jgi:hypothetical protein